jgi:hypothetical protein
LIGPDQTLRALFHWDIGSDAYVGADESGQDRTLDREIYKQRNQIGPMFRKLENLKGLQPATTKSQLSQRT